MATIAHRFLRDPEPSWMREPLLHFVLLGALLLAVDHMLAGRAADPHAIVVSADVDSQMVNVFKASAGRPPNAQELEALHRVWLDDEVLYREGMALQVDKTDRVIRERVISGALSVIDANIKLPPIDDSGLREWFENHRDKYDQPAHYDFEEALLSGDKTKSAVTAFVDTLNHGPPVETQARLRVFKDQPSPSLVESYGPDFPQELAASRTGVWRALDTREGWCAIKPLGMTAPKPADYESLRSAVLQDWKDATAAEQRAVAVRALAKKYTVTFETPRSAGE
jgi:hypothetical protein